MKVILTHEVTTLGTAGDVVDVKDGYARNFLFRRGLATAWTKGGQKQVDAINKGREVRAVKTLEEAQSIKGNLEAKTVKVEAHAGQSGRLFGAVSTADIAAAVKAAGGPSSTAARSRCATRSRRLVPLRRSFACTPTCRPP